MFHHQEKLYRILWGCQIKQFGKIDRIRYATECYNSTTFSTKIYFEFVQLQKMIIVGFLYTWFNIYLQLNTFDFFQQENSTNILNHEKSLQILVKETVSIHYCCLLIITLLTSFWHILFYQMNIFGFSVFLSFLMQNKKSPYQKLCNSSCGLHHFLELYIMFYICYQIFY